MSNLNNLNMGRFSWSLTNREAAQNDNSIEAKYQEMLEDAIAGKHSQNADNCDLQEAVARIVATEIKLNPKLFALDSDSAIFTRIGYQVACLVERELNQCAKFYAEVV